MTLTVVNRWSCADEASIVKYGAIIGAIMRTHGATWTWVGRIASGPQEGQYISILQFPDMDTWLLARERRTAEPAFNEAFAAFKAVATLIESLPVEELGSSGPPPTR